jgi:electron transport complex protein RnfA
MIRLAALGICASLAMNLLVQFGLGLGTLMENRPGDRIGDKTGERTGDRTKDRMEQSRDSYSLQSLFFFISLFFLWLLFSYILSPLGPDFYWYLLIYPLSAALIRGLEALGSREKVKSFFTRRLGGSFRVLLPRCWTEFLVLGLLISLHLAQGPLEALILALCFSLGLGFSLAVLREISRRSRFEAVPPFLRGSPLALISLGLLSLIFSSASIMFFNLSR